MAGHYEYGIADESNDWQAPATWVDDGPEDVGNAQYTQTQEQYDRAAAEGLGMSYEDYLALSGTGRAPVGNYTDENQSDAETKRLADMAKDPSANGLGGISPGNDISTGDGSTWDKVATALKLKNPDGSYDWSKLLAVGGLGVSAIGSLTQTPEKQKTIAELKAGMPGMNAPQSFSPETLAMMQRPMQTGSALQRVYAADMQSPIVPGRKYAEGGPVDPEEQGEMPGALSQAFSGAVQGSDGGQSDMVDAKLSPGEYVLDAETVSALGDGNTAAGIAKLDELRAKLREQKRSAPAQDIPPQAQGPLSYMQGA